MIGVTTAGDEGKVQATETTKAPRPRLLRDRRGCWVTGPLKKILPPV
jgi:hypothetical protein